jgi:hypothetical protein
MTLYLDHELGSCPSFMTYGSIEASVPIGPAHYNDLTFALFRSRAARIGSEISLRLLAVSR